jgi:hypothetical protein
VENFVKKMRNSEKNMEYQGGTKFLNVDNFVNNLRRKELTLEKRGS